MAKKKTIPSYVLYAILLIVLGILFLVGGAGTAKNLLNIILTVGGVVLVVLGVLNLLAGLLPIGIAYLIFGVLLIAFAWTLAWIAFLAIGVLLLVNGIANLAKRRGWVVNNVIALVVGILVLLLAFGVNWAWSFVNIIFYVVGALMIVEGILVLVKK
ncbi:MAG: hypothetical protein PUJ43_00860 [Bacillales bacterium]|nr:hypothetical protein [Bacillales bacterium]MDY5919647.1 hypothetical protein [Candidatus Enteromonas sp.]